MTRHLGLRGASVALALAAAATAHAGSGTITEIDIRDNTKTTDATVIQIADVELGDAWDDAMMAEVRDRLEASGLFATVLVAPEPAPNGTRLVIVAKDKHSWVVAPTYYDQPTNRGGGIGFGENNLFGENKKLLLYAQAATGDSFFIGAYVDPSIRNTRWRWQYDVYLKTARSFEYAPPERFRGDTAQLRESRMRYLNTGARLGLTLGPMTLDVRGRGARVSFVDRDLALAEGATLEDVTGDPAATELPSPGVEGTDLSTEVMLAYDTRSNWFGITRGTRFKLSLERSLDALGSDFSYWLGYVSFDHAVRFLTRHNLDVRTRAGYGHHLPFQQEFTGGGTSLRGWQNDQFRGDLKLSGNAEYSFPLFEIKGVALRGLGFADVSYVTFREADNPQRHYLPGAAGYGLAPLKTSFGLGTRVYMRQIVLPLLGLDVGYSPEREAYEIYLAIGLTDV